MSHRIAQMADRYLALLNSEPLPHFSESEMNALYDVNNGTWHEPAELIRGSLAMGMEDSIADGICEKWNIDGKGLINKLEKLSFNQEIALVEKIEKYWNKGKG